MTARPAFTRAKDSNIRPINGKNPLEWGYLCNDTNCGLASHYHYKDRQGAERRIREKGKGNGDPPKEVRVDSLQPCSDVKKCIALQHAHYHLYCEPCSEVPTKVEVAACNVVQLPTTCGGGVSSQVYEMMTPMIATSIPNMKCTVEVKEETVIVDKTDRKDDIIDKMTSPCVDVKDEDDDGAFIEVPDEIDTTETTTIYVNPEIFKKNMFEGAWNFVAGLLGLTRVIELPDARHFNQFIHTNTQSMMTFDFFGHPIPLYKEEHTGVLNGSRRGYRAYYKAEVYTKLYQFLITEVFQISGVMDDGANKFLPPRVMATVMKDVNAAWYSNVNRLNITLNTVFAVLNYKFHEGCALRGHMGVSQAIIKSRNPFSSLNFQSSPST